MKLVVHYDFYLIAWVFLIYAVLGWCAEVAFAAFKTKTFVNRGFLNGPYCPIYGFGMLIVVLCLTPIADNLLILFAGSFLLTSLLELVTGFVLEKFFDDKWWDYSDQPLNFHGYVCLTFSILWGVACVLIMRILHPPILKLIRLIPHKPGIVLLVVFFALFLADVGMTVSTLLHLKKQLRLVREINRQLRELSDSLGESIYSGTVAAIRITDRAKEDLEASADKVREGLEDSKARALQEFEEFKNRHRSYVSRYHFGTGRLMKAFPSFRQGKGQEMLDILSELWDKKDTGKK